MVDLFPRSATDDFVGGYASPVLLDLFPMMSDCSKHACHIKARGPTGHDEECALQSLGIDVTRKIVESVRFEIYRKTITQACLLQFRQNLQDHRKHRNSPAFVAAPRWHRSKNKSMSRFAAWNKSII